MKSTLLIIICSFLLTTIDAIAGGFWELMRLEPDNDTYQVSMSSALGRTTVYEVINSNNQERRTNTYPDGTHSEETTLSNGTIIQVQANETKITQKLGADPRFGVVAPLTESLKIQLPSGLTAILQASVGCVRRVFLRRNAPSLLLLWQFIRWCVTLLLTHPTLAE